MGIALAGWIVRWRFWILAAAVVIVALVGSGARNLQFTTDYRVFFGEENPQLTAFETLQNTYTKNDNIMFVVAPKGGDVFTRKTLGAIETLTDLAWKTPYSIRVDSLSNFQFTRANDDELIVEDLVTDAGELSDHDLSRIRSIALAEPQLADRIVSSRGHVSGINVTVQLPGANPEHEVPEVVAYARGVAAEMVERFPEIDIYLTGVVMLNNAFPEATQHDLRTLVPLMFVVVIITLGLLVRSVPGTIATVLVIFFSIATAMGLAGWLEMRLTGPSAAAPTIILTLAVADCVHFLTNFVQGMRGGLDKRAAMTESLRLNLQPIFLTSLTTAIGFLSMNFSDAPPFRDLGNIVAMGVAAAFLWAIVFLPAVVIVFPVSAQGGQVHGTRVMVKIAEFVVTRHRVLLWGLGPILLLLMAFIPRNELNDEFVKYFDESIEFRRATDFATANLTGIYAIQYSLGSGQPDGISQPEFLRKVEAFAQWYRQQPGVIHVNTITDTLKRLNKNLHGDDSRWYRVPQERQLAAQYLLLYEMSLPYGLDLNGQINVDKSATHFVATLDSLSTKQLLALEGRARSWLEANAPTSMQVDGSSPAVMFSHIGARNIRSMLIGTTVALVLISLVLVLALRSVKIGLVSMFPNLVPAALAFGLWGLLVGRVGLALSVVTAMTLGIVVDDTVHFLSKYLRARRESSMSPADAIRYSFASVGTALWVTSVVLIAGFLVLSRSAFEINAGMGLLTAITIAFALIADFFYLPPLLMTIDRYASNHVAAEMEATKPVP